MQCPIDGETLLMTAREGVEIDYCPRCRGVWLDRGELDKIIERSEPATSASTSTQVRQPVSAKRDDDDDDDRKKDRDVRKGRDRKKDDDRPDYYRKSNRHASFIKELFDF